MARISLYSLLLAVIAPYLYDRYQAFSHLAANRPGKFQEIYNIKSHDIRFKNRIRNCEDVVLNEDTGLAILSCDPGRDRWNTVMGHFHPGPGLENGGIWIYDYSTPNLADGEALKPLTLKKFATQDFHPLGIEFESSTSTLYVVNHAQTGSVIDIFHVSIKDYTATHVLTLKHPLIHTPNSIHALGDGKFFFTNDHFVRAAASPLLSSIETRSGAPGGSVVFFDVNDFDAAKTVARVPFANGITMINSTTLVVGSSTKPALFFYHVTPKHDVKPKGFVRTPAAVDNVSVDGKGTLLVAGHPFAPSLMALSKNRWKCDAHSDKEEERAACDCASPSWAAEWTEEGGLMELYKGHEFCSSTMAVRDSSRGVGMISGLYERGIMVFKE